MFSVKVYILLFVCGFTTLPAYHGYRLYFVDGKSIDLGAGQLCDLGIITAPLWTSEFSCIK